ncbi:MAG: 1,4-alpha-glucan branching protein GlgB [Planctomycetota bacterium]|nr:MAG: 1,4-alpha-glucan branching protein GlgB [Planctomycetota bacterium]
MEANTKEVQVRTTVPLEHVGQLIEGRHENPFEILGPHVVHDGDRKAVAVRAYLPRSKQAWVIDLAHNGVPRPMRRIHPAGLFEAVCPANDGDPPKYLLRVAEEDGKSITMHDPYAFPPLLSDFDRYLLNEGRHWRCYEKLGAQIREIDGVRGVNFAVWAPNATSVSVVGTFNDWDGRAHQMRKHIPSGFWELFVPGVKEGDLYKFRIRHYDQVFDKADPFAFAAEVPPGTASKVADLTHHQWNDAEWMARRAETDWLKEPISIYEVHLGSWRRSPDTPQLWLGYRDLVHQLVDYVKEMGYTHIELLPVAEHPLTASWGYQVTGYFAPTSRYGTPEDFMYFVDYCHQNGIGVIVDWVPAHFPRDAHGLRRFDGTALYEHEDPRQGEHRDWGTHIFNYGRYEVRNFLIANALFWLDKYHVDGLRVDAVASMLYLDYSREPGDWIPNEFGGRENLQAIAFLKLFNEQVHQNYPGVLTIAEESTAWPGVTKPTYDGGLGFTMKWNMGWMNDTRSYMHRDPIYRRYHHDQLTFSLIYAFHENFVLPLSHDEVVHGKGSLLDQMPGDLWQKFANLRLLYSYMWTHPGKKLLFMGGEFGQWAEWNFDKSLDWHLLQWETHQGVQRCMADLNRLLRSEKALHQQDYDWHGFQWIDCHNWEESTLSYIRRAEDPADYLVVACNFTPVPRLQHRIGVPENCWYREIFNSDSEYYGGSNLGNFPGVQAEPLPWHDQPASMQIVLPPLGAVIFKPERNG